ncbi:MAG TPA: TolC family protein [Chryseosolibacter sp.]
MKNILLSCITAALALTASAQNQQPDSVLTFKGAVDIALKNNVNIIQQKNNLNLTQVNRTFRAGQLGPQAQINGSAGRSNGNNWIQQEGRVVNATVDAASATLQVSMPIFGGLSGVNTLRQANSQLDAQMAFVKRTAQDVINTVATQYLQVLLDQELLKIAEENVALQKTILDQVKAQVEVGSRSPVDEFNQQAQVSNAELRAVQAEFALINDKATLFQSLMFDPTYNVRINEPSWDVNSIALDNLSLDDLVQTALTNRADLKQAQYTERASKFGMHAAKGNYLPSLTAFYQNGSAWNLQKGTPRDSSYRNFSDQFFTDNRRNYLGVGLTIPLFSGFQNRAIYYQSKVQFQNNQALTKSREIVVKGDVVRAYENFVSIKKAYSAGLVGLEASQMAYNLEQERFNLGITSFVDFANANRTFIQAQVDMAQAKYRFLFQKVLLDYAIGTLKPEDLPE